MKPWLPLSVLLSCISAVLAAGCTPELSKLEGVSIKRCYHQSGGQWQDAQGRYREEGPLWAFIENRHRDLRVISSVDLTQSYDLASPPIDAGAGEGARTQLLCAVRETFGISIWEAEREIPVLALVGRERAQVALRASPPTSVQRRVQQPPPTIATLDPIYNIGLLFRPYEPTRYSFTAYSMADLVPILESDGSWMCSPEATSDVVVDETGLQDRYDFDLIVDRRKGLTMREAVRDLGLELVPVRRAIRAVYVDVDPSKKPSVSL